MFNVIDLSWMASKLSKYLSDVKMPHYVPDDGKTHAIHIVNWVYQIKTPSYITEDTLSECVLKIGSAVMEELSNILEWKKKSTKMVADAIILKVFEASEIEYKRVKEVQHVTGEYSLVEFTKEELIKFMDGL